MTMREIFLHVKVMTYDNYFITATNDTKQEKAGY